MNRTDHAAEARNRIGWTRWWQEQQGITPETGVAMALLAQAEATLALVEQPCPPWGRNIPRRVRISAGREPVVPPTPDASRLHSWARQIADRFGDEWEHTGGCQGDPLEMGGCPLCCILAATSPNTATTKES